MVLGGGRSGRGATTDDQGRYIVTDLGAGSYTITASKNGFVDAVFGQRRPQQPGTPVTIADAQAATNIDLRLTRGGVITGTVQDEDGEALPRAIVSVQRYQYVGGERQLRPAGGDQTDDRGQYRVFGLPPEASGSCSAGVCSSSRQASARLAAAEVAGAEADSARVFSGR
jgi:hypothetical protein